MSRVGGILTASQLAIKRGESILGDMSCAAVASSAPANHLLLPCLRELCTDVPWRQNLFVSTFRHLTGCPDIKYLAHPFASHYGWLGTLCSRIL